VRCLEEGAFRAIAVKPFDGQHWEDAMASAERD
jgi:hypothetical protein